MSSLMKEFGVVGVPIVEAHSEFLAPSSYGDMVEVTSWVSEWRGKFCLHHMKSIIRGD